MQNSSMMMTDLYRIVITQARYGGTYEGGKWIAFANYDEIDVDLLNNYIYGDDEGAIDLFDSDISVFIGVGDTPDSALENLIRKHVKHTTAGEL